MLWKATDTAEKEMQNMKHVWKRYLIVTAMTVVLGLAAGCGNVADDTNNNRNNTQDENTTDGNENKNNTDGSQVPAGDNNGTDGNSNMNGATPGRYGMREWKYHRRPRRGWSVRESKMWETVSEKVWRI